MKTNFIKNRKTYRDLEEKPDKIVYEFARQLLDVTYPTIPMSKPSGMTFGKKTANSGYLRRSTMRSGVQTSGKTVYLESPATYAPYVYNFPDGKTNWSTPGTHSRWFDRTFKEKGKAIFDQVVSRNKI